MSVKHSEADPKQRRLSPLAVIFLTVAVDLIGFGIILPLTPLYARRYGASEAMVAVLFASYSFMQFVFAPIWGRISDRIGRRPILMLSIAGNVVALIIFALADSFVGLLAARMLSGFFTANIAVANAYIADISPPELRAKRMGLIGAAFGIGFVIGPFLGGELTRFGMSAPPFFAAGLALVNLISAAFLLPESLPKHARDTSKAKGFFSRFEVIRQVPGLGTIVTLVFAQIAAFSMLEMAFTLFLNDRLGFEERHAGRVFAYIGVVLVIVQGGLIGPLTRHLGEARLVRRGLLTVGAGMLLLVFLPQAEMPTPVRVLLMLAGLLTLIAVGQGVVSPALTALLSRQAPQKLQGVALGLSHSLSAAARIVGPLAAGILYKFWGENMPFIVGGSMMILAWGLAMAMLDGVASASAPTKEARSERSSA